VRLAEGNQAEAARGLADVRVREAASAIDAKQGLVEGARRRISAEARAGAKGIAEGQGARGRRARAGAAGPRRGQRIRAKMSAEATGSRGEGRRDEGARQR
jgi:hypothetical protein